jgi:hypothetical protein
MLLSKCKAEETASMSDANFDREEPGFTFTDEDYARRYFPGQSSAAVRSAKSVASAASAKHAGPLHGGGNSFMRARRRRLAASRTG